MNERQAAQAFSSALDIVLAGDHGGRTAVSADDSTDDNERLLTVARRLQRLPQLLPLPDSVLRQRVLMATVPEPPRWQHTRPRWRVFVPALATLLLLLSVALFTVPGRTAMAAFAARFGLGRFAVQVTPQPGGQGESFLVTSRQKLDSIEDAQALVDFDVLFLSVLPPGYELREVAAISYEGMPVWIPQPFYLEMEYSGDSDLTLYHLTIREFGLALKEGEYIRSIRQVDFASQDVSQAQDVLVGDRPGVILTMTTGAEGAPLRRLIWQQDDVLLEMLSQTLAAEDMLAIAGQMVHVK